MYISTYLLQKIASLFVSRLLSNMKVITVSFIYFLVCCGRSAAQLTTAEKQEALEFHNDLRRSEGASDMFCMVTIILHTSTALVVFVVSTLYVFIKILVNAHVFCTLISI